MQNYYNNSKSIFFKILFEILKKYIECLYAKFVNCTLFRLFPRECLNKKMIRTITLSVHYIPIHDDNKTSTKDKMVKIKQ